MTKVLVRSSLLAKSMVASYTRSDGVTVQAHDNGKQAAAPKPMAAGRRMAKKLSFVSSASKDGAGDASSDKQAAPDNGKPVKRVVKQLKAYHKADAKSLKSSLGSALSSGDTEGDDGKPLTYGNVKRHLQTMRSQLGKDAVSAQHLEHAQYAVNQSMGADHAPLSEKHAKLIGAALSGRTRIDDNGAVRHA